MIGAYTVVDDSGASWNLYQIRNPHASDKYNGTWRDNDTKWTDNVKAQVPYKNASDGVTWISHTDFIKAFSEFSIAYYTDDWKHNIVEVIGDTGSTREFKFITTKDQPVYILQEFYNPRIYPGSSCKSVTTKGKITLLKDGVVVDSR